MSSKRKLYKPAVQENVTLKDRRRPLAQGRLETGVASDGAKKAVTQHESHHHDPSLRTTIGHSPMLGSPRHDLASSRTGSANPRDESQLGPRRATPSKSEHQSPKPARPSRSLDVSDTESDLLFSPRGQFSDRLGDRFEQSVAKVVVMDASHQTRDPNQSEVDVQVGFEHSPVRVVCHSPAVVYSNLRNSGNVEMARKVAVDQVPSIQVVSEGNQEHVHRSSRYKSPLVVPEGTIAGNVDPSYSSDKSEVVKALFPHDGSLTETGLMEGSGGRDQLRVMLPSKLDLSGSSVEGGDRFSESGEFKVKEETDKAASTKTTEAPKTGKKKKGVRVVPSRYMQAAKGPMKATDRTLVDKCQNKSRASRSGHESGLLAPKKTDSGLLGPKKTGNTTNGVLPSRKTAGGTKNPVPTLPPKRSSSLTRHNVLKAKPSGGGRVNVSGFSTTPEARGSGGFASTPTSEENFFQGGVSGDVDISAIQMHHAAGHHSAGASIFHTPDSTMNASDASRKSAQGPARSKSSRNAGRRKEESSQELTQLQLDQMYTRYLQWLFVRTKAEKCFQEQEKQFMAQYYGLWEETEKLHRRKSELQLELAKLKHLNKLDEALDLQESGLSGLVPRLTQHQQQSDTLAGALDTTRHQIQTRGIHIPDDEDVFQEALLSALRESEQLLGEVSVMTRHATPKITRFAESLGVMEKTLGSEVTELSSCQELVAAAQSLTIQECSLRAQEIELQG